MVQFVEIIIGVTPCLLKDMQHRIMTLEIYLFSSSSHVPSEWHQTKVPASLLWLMQILDLSLNITFIQLSTYHDSFSLAHINLIFFCLCVSASFHFDFLCINPISFNLFLKVLSQTLIPVLTHFFICTFSIFIAYCFQFSILTLWCFLLSINMFSFFNHSIYLHTIFDTADWEQPMFFFHTAQWIVFLNKVRNPFNCLNWLFFCWNHIPF